MMAYTEPVAAALMNQSQSMVLYLMSDNFARNVESGVWDFLPGYPHPRGLTGCRFWTSWEVSGILQVNLCSADDRFRSLRTACPESCDCKSHMPECPYGCAGHR